MVIDQKSESQDALWIDGDVVQPIYIDKTALAIVSSEYQVPDVGVIVSGMHGMGIRIKGLLELATLQRGADHVTFHSQDGHFAASLTLNQANEYGILIYQVDGGPLSVQKGGPFRLVTPGLGDLCANVKHVSRIEITKGLGKDTRPSNTSC